MIVKHLMGSYAKQNRTTDKELDINNPLKYYHISVTYV